MYLKDFKGKKIHLTGVTGVGMTALAQLFKDLGAQVSGSDTGEEFFTVDILNNLKIPFKRKFAAENITKAEIVVSSAAYLSPYSGNPEILKAKEIGLPLLSYPDVLAMFFRENFGVAVAGSHGKTTTSALLSVVLERAGFDPTAVVGAKVLNWGANARSGRFVKSYNIAGNNNPKPSVFVAEADEYREAFLKYRAGAAIVTGIDWDHPDHYPAKSDYRLAFEKFVRQMPAGGFLVANGDDNQTREVASLSSAKVIFYGRGENNNFVLSDFKQEAGVSGFSAVREGSDLGNFKTRLIGLHNALNALAALAAALELGGDLDEIREGIRDFSGTARRFEKLGEREGVLIYDDYAHHPVEIKSTLKAVREAFKERRLWAVFQPHTYSRTAALLADFALSFGSADKIVILDIYASAREKKGDVSSTDLFSRIKEAGGDVYYEGSIDRAASFLKDNVKKGDIVLTLGAGDVWQAGRKLLK